MDAFQPVLKVLVPIGVGVLLRAAGLFGDREGDLLRGFVMRFAIPVLAFFSLAEADAGSTAAVVPMTAAFVLMTAALFVLGWIASRFVEGGPAKAAVHASVTFANYGWMGLGIVGALFGPAGSQRVICFILLFWPVFYAFGLLIGRIHCDRLRGPSPVRSVLAIGGPIIGAGLLGLLANRVGLRVPAFLAEPLRPFGQMAAPLILLSVGLTLDATRLRGAIGPALMVSAITLLAGPLIGWGLAAVLAGDPLSFKVIVLEGAMPVAVAVVMLQDNYAIDRELAGTTVVLSTLLSLATIPLLVGVLGV
jgi:predicted permease